MVEIIKDKSNGVNHIGHRIALSILAGLQVLGSTNVHRIAEEEFIDEVSINLTINVVLLIYAVVILKKSDQNRLWIMMIIVLLMTSTGLYLDPVIEMRGDNAE